MHNLQYLFFLYIYLFKYVFYYIKVYKRIRHKNPMSKGAFYKHDLGSGLSLNAYPVDPSINEQALRQMVSSKDGTRDPNLALDSIFVARVSSIDDLKIEVLKGTYKVPEQLQAFRDALGFQWDAKGRYAGPVLIIDKILQHPIRGHPGVFYDWAATDLDKVPYQLEQELKVLTQIPKDSLIWRAFSEDLIKGAGKRTLKEVYAELALEGPIVGKLKEDLGILLNLPENSLFWFMSPLSFAKAGGGEKLREVFEKIRGKYAQGKTVETIFQENGISNNKRGKYLGLSYLMSPSNGEEVCFVQRAKGMAIAADCISSCGSTPNPRFKDMVVVEYNTQTAIKINVINEMNEEWGLKPDEFNIGTIDLFDSKRSVPFGSVQIVTSLSTGDLVERIHGDPEAIKEHPVVYSTNQEGIKQVLERFPTYPSFGECLKVFEEQNRQS